MLEYVASPAAVVQTRNSSQSESWLENVVPPVEQESVEARGPG